MKILFDTNVVLDLLLNREPFAKDAAILFNAVESCKIQGVLCATTITTIDYLCAKSIGGTLAKQAIKSLLELFLIAEVNQKILVAALDSSFADFEDAVLYQAGIYVGVDGLVTRNVKDFSSAESPVYTPPDLCQIIQTVQH
ncbi:PIN domain-containing protein [Methylovulum miyakonense]|uniref:PIN domain-containing protein n=1 Tax=Methylovulum miyakonense TaxID=645578 RepID=UPI00035DA635|nr:PIN domain-containing protein [Methylovulum miyakonense]